MSEAMNDTNDVQNIVADTKSENTEATTEVDIPQSREAENPANINEETAVDYEELIENDLSVLRAEFPELKNIKSITDLDNPIRYAALRDLGLDAAEAYMATAKRSRQDNRAHLRAAYGKNVSTPYGTMSHRELNEARELFTDLSDLEIQRLYRKVTG